MNSKLPHLDGRRLGRRPRRARQRVARRAGRHQDRHRRRIPVVAPAVVAAIATTVLVLAAVATAVVVDVPDAVVEEGLCDGNGRPVERVANAVENTLGLGATEHPQSPQFGHPQGALRERGVALAYDHPCPDEPAAATSWSTRLSRMTWVGATWFSTSVASDCVLTIDPIRCESQAIWPSIAEVSDPESPPVGTTRSSRRCQRRRAPQRPSPCRRPRPIPLQHALNASHPFLPLDASGAVRPQRSGSREGRRSSCGVRVRHGIFGGRPEAYHHHAASALTRRGGRETLRSRRGGRLPALLGDSAPSRIAPRHTRGAGLGGPAPAAAGGCGATSTDHAAKWQCTFIEF